MLEYLTLCEFVVALLMAGVGLCAYLWAAASGLWRDVEAPKYRVLEVEEKPRD
jgi:cbb3-type cytochrome oxidase maturation protein